MRCGTFSGFKRVLNGVCVKPHQKHLKKAAGGIVPLQIGSACRSKGQDTLCCVCDKASLVKDGQLLRRLVAMRIGFLQPERTDGAGGRSSSKQCHLIQFFLTD